MSEQVWMSEEVAPDYLDASVTYVRFHFRVNQIPVVYVDDQPGYLVDDVYRLLERLRVHPGSLLGNRKPTYRPPDGGTSDGWMTEPQAAERLGISLATLKNLVRTGRLPIDRRRPRQGGIRAEDVDDLLSASRIEPGTMSQARELRQHS
jgi:excisionase family DNA binding protein